MNIDKFNLFASDVALNKTRNICAEIAGPLSISSRLINDVKIDNGDFAYLVCPNNVVYVAMGTPEGNVLLNKYEDRVRVFTPTSLEGYFANLSNISDEEFEKHFFATKNLGHFLAEMMAK